jgi:hypothetical protein
VTATLGTPAMRFHVEGWDPGYGTAFEAEPGGDALSESSARVDVAVEVPAERWRPVAPSPRAAVPAALLFVDGVRRIDAQVWIDEPAPDGGPATSATQGLCASYAAGAVLCRASEARVLLHASRRGLFTVAPHARDLTTGAGVYRAHHATAGDATPVPVALSAALQQRLGELEIETAVAAREELDRLGVPAGDELLVVDGPLRGRQHLSRSLGYVKSHRSTYLPPELNAVVARLAPGERTPVFHMGTSWDRHSWYLRLPGRPGAPWAGVVRVECGADLDRATVVGLADATQLTLPRYAGVAYKDARAPQNLHPIAGLERELRRRLGDPRYVYRLLQSAAA